MDIVSEMPIGFKIAREWLLNAFPKEKIEGLDTARAEDFIRSEGLVVKPYIIFEDKDMQLIEAIAQGTLRKDAFSHIGNSPVSGLYAPELDLVLVRRSLEMEDLNDPVYTEGILVHELAHGSNTYQTYITKNNTNFHTPRVGLCLPQNQMPYGWMLEEGWADMMRGKYVEKFASNKFKDGIALLISHDPKIAFENKAIITFDNLGKEVPLPYKYFCKNKDNKLSFTISSLAAYGLEMMCDKDRTLKPLLIKARFSAASLKELSQYFNKIKPGFYSELQRGGYTIESFADKLSTILETVR